MRIEPANAAQINLVMSIFLTHDRAENRFHRLDIFLASILSYSKIKFRNVYLYISLDWDFKFHRSYIEKYCKNTLRYDEIEIRYERLLKQDEWKLFFSDKIGQGDLWWFSQNDDHPLMLSNSNYLLSLVEKCRLIQGPASIYLSHWPEMVALSQALGDHSSSDDDYFLVRCVLIDSIQIFNESLIMEIFFNFTWPVAGVKRIDRLFIAKEISGENFLPKPTFNQHILVPAVEVCRKFNGYKHVGLKFDCSLSLRKTSSHEVFSDGELRDYVGALHYSDWHRGKSPVLSETTLEKIDRTNALFSGTLKLMPFERQKLEHTWFFQKSYIVYNLIYILKSIKYRCLQRLRGV